MKVNIKFMDDLVAGREYYCYGMRLRGFSIGCQPKNGIVQVLDDPTNTYYDILVYDRKLTEKEIADYELDELEKIGESRTDV